LRVWGPTFWLPAVLFLLGIALAVFGVVFPLEKRPGAVDYIPLDVTLGLSFVLAGTVAWLRRPDNPTGILLTLTGLVYFGHSFYWWKTSFGDHLGDLALNLTLALLAHQFVVFPRGRARSGLERFLIGSAYALAVLGYAFGMLFYDPQLEGCFGCRTNLLLVHGSHEAYTLVRDVVASLSLALAAVILVRLLWRWRRASPPARRTLTPVVCVAPIVAAVVVLTLTHNGLGVQAPFSFGGSRFIEWAVFAYVGLPLAFLAGLLRTRLHRTSLGSLVVELAGSPSPGQVEGALARALGDPSLQVAYRASELGRYVDAAGRPVELPHDREDRAVTLLEQDGAPFAALVYDPSLLEDEAFVDAAAAAARLALVNASLQAELRANLAEVRASRARIVAAADAERRRVERNLHDGAQQRLVTLALQLRLLEERVRADPELDRLVEESLTELGVALAELRELAQGLHPSVLTDHGLAPALEELAERAPLPVTVDAPPERYASAVEATAYYVAAEALTNVAKYAGASSARVLVARENGSLRIEVADDGVGGADPAHGSGLRGLADRVAALDGRLEVTSASGSGTRILASLPCG
jgi:signal transduction histidine kinase